MLVVLLLLLSVAVVNLDAMRHGAELREGVLRLESLLHFARAEAALRGQRVRVALLSQPAEDDPDPAEIPREPVTLSIETDPLNRPGEFAALPSTSWGNRRLGELIQIELILDAGVLFGEVAGQPETPARRVSLGSGRAVRRSVVFDPEGGAANTRLVVRSADVEDTRKMLVELDGLTGRVTHRELTSDGFEELQVEADEEEATDGATDDSTTSLIGGYSR